MTTHLSASAAAAAAGIPRDTLASWLHRGYLRSPIGGWRREDVRRLLVFRLLLDAGLPADAAGLLIDRSLPGAIDAGRGYLLLFTVVFLSTAGGEHAKGETLWLDTLAQVEAAITARMRQTGAAKRFIVLDLADIARHANDGFAMIAASRRRPGRPRKESA